jgi:hypothetical protein
MQQQLIAGDSLNFFTGVLPYSPADGWALQYTLVPVAGGAVITLNGVAEGGEWRILAAASTTAAWAAGEYNWRAKVDKAGEKYTVDEGRITIRPDLQAAGVGYDTRSTARKALEDLRAALSAWSPLRKRYRIGEREMEFNSPADIIKLITWWEQQVAKEDTLAGRVDKPSRRIFSRI